MSWFDIKSEWREILGNAILFIFYALIWVGFTLFMVGIVLP